MVERHDGISLLLHKIACALVDDVDVIRTEVLPEGDALIFRIHSAPQDTGKLIGKQGRTARSLRVILAGAGMKSNQKFLLDIVNHDRPEAVNGRGDDGAVI